MIEAAEETRRAFFQSQVGRVESVLAETVLPDGTVEGYTMNYTPGRAVGMIPGKIFDVQLLAFDENGCTGSVLPTL